MHNLVRIKLTHVKRLHTKRERAVTSVLNSVGVTRYWSQSSDCKWLWASAAENLKASFTWVLTLGTTNCKMSARAKTVTFCLSYTRENKWEGVWTRSTLLVATPSNFMQKPSEASCLTRAAKTSGISRHVTIRSDCEVNQSQKHPSVCELLSTL